ncbi:MAG: hypothetical protein AB8G22_25780 [Saprospiraceae bacterium]
MDNVDKIIESRILERYVLGLTDREENKILEPYINRYPKVREQVQVIRNAMSNLVQQHNIPPPPRSNSDSNRAKRQGWFNNLFQ